MPDLTIPADEWARVSAAARQWGLAVAVLRDQEALCHLPEDASDMLRGLAAVDKAWQQGSRHGMDEAWGDVVDAAQAESDAAHNPEGGK